MTSQLSCPFDSPQGAPTNDPVGKFQWYELTKRRHLGGAALVSLVVVSLSVAGAVTHTIGYAAAVLISVAICAAAVSVAVHLYVRKTAIAFWPAKQMDSTKPLQPGRIPVHGVIQTLWDIVMRPRTLLREIDLERMRKYGDIYLMFYGLRPVVVVTTAALSEQISKAYDIFHKSDPRDLGMPFYFRWVGNDNVVLANGEQWRSIRHLILPALSAVQIFVPVFLENARTLCAALKDEVAKAKKASASEDDGAEVLLSRWLKAMSLDSSGTTLFGFNFNHLREETNRGIEAMDYVVSEIFDPLRVAMPSKNRLPLKSNRRLQQCMEHLDHLVLEMITNISQETPVRPATNVLEILMRGRQRGVLNTHELRNNIVAMVIASYETTQVSLSGILYFLARFPEIQEKLRHESAALLSDLENDENSLYRRLLSFHSLDNFIMESLRMYSPLANQNSRTTAQDTELGGYRIPKGVLITMNIHAVHMNPAEWENPEQFNPDRFKDLNARQRYAHLAFGGAPRTCAGKKFSLIEQKIVVCLLLRHFSFALPSDSYQVPIRRGSFTGIPNSSFRLRLTPLSGQIQQTRSCELDGVVAEA